MVTADRQALATVVLPTWMVMNGFLVDHLGELSWHEWADLDRFLVVAGGIGPSIVTAYLSGHELQERWLLGAAVQEMRSEINEEKKQRA